jgi:hypothetical protein
VSTAEDEARIDLFWIPLGAGGSGFVRLNGRIYEWFAARLDRRPPLDLYHTALQVHLPEGRFVVETMWPVPDTDMEARGVVAVGPVWNQVLGRARTFRYEVRCWRDGVLPDAGEAVGGPVTVSTEPSEVRRLLAETSLVPRLTWGRDEAGVGEMWNSNSVVSWLLASSGLEIETIHPPAGGRAPGWGAGVAIARHRDGDLVVGEV